jgi:voltage-gated potassium channel
MTKKTKKALLRAWYYITAPGHELRRLLLMALGTVLLASCMLYAVEHRVNPNVSNIGEAIIWVLVFIASGFDVSPATPAGQLIGLGLVVAGAVFLGLFAGSISAAVVETHLGRRKKVDLRTLSGHFIICGWQERTRELVRQFHSPNVKARPVVIIDRNVEDKHNLDGDPLAIFIKGDPTNEDDLKRARIDTAEAAIVLADMSVTPAESDARALLVTLTIETLNSAVHSCVEARDPSNIAHLKYAHADEVVSVSDVTGHMLVQAALNPGVTAAYNELLSTTYGNEIYEVPVTAQMAGKTFREVSGNLFAKGYILIGLRVDGIREVKVNPDRNTIINGDDQLLLIAETTPRI